MMRAQGLHVFPIYSQLLGPNVSVSYDCIISVHDLQPNAGGV